MSRATFELDFFGMEEDSSAKSSFPKFCRQRSLLAISKMNPEILKSVIATCSSNQLIDSKKSFSVLSAPKEDPTPFPILPVYSPLQRPSFENPSQTAPLTIFYNGIVTVFDVPKDKAETILKLAENGISKSVEPSNQQQMLGTLDGDLPIARRKSLQRFLEKRKERLTSASLYAFKPSDTHS